jgi:hypothetical protein
VTIRNQRQGWYIVVWFSVACAGARTSQPAAPLPTPTSPAEIPAPTVPTAGSWSFKHSPGAVTYQISRSAAIETRDLDLPVHREISTNTTHELLTFEPADQAVNFTAVVDTFTTTTQGLIGPVQPVQLPIQLSGSFLDNTLTIRPDSTNGTCSPITSALVTDLHNLLVTFPAQLSSGVAWKDSTDVKGCQAGVPTSTHTVRSYTVSGEGSYEGRPVLLIQRVDTTHAQGEGGLQQHRISIDASGTGNAVYYLDTVAGRILRLTVDQILNLKVTASGRDQHFRQDSKQDFRASP